MLAEKIKREQPPKELTDIRNIILENYVFKTLILR